jgi:Icc-related predicted phosphoesterase
MKFIHLSDLHIKKEDVDISQKINMDKFLHTIRSNITKDELALFTVCGDIIDKGSKENYENARNLFDKINEGLEDYNLYMEFVPGNHDIKDGSFKYFENFVKNYQNIDTNDFIDKSIIVREYDDINIVLINTSYHVDHTYGYIDYGLLESKLNACTNDCIIVMHHTLMSKYEDDTSALRDAYKFADIVSKYNVKTVLHGHIHGYSYLNISNLCDVIAVGPFFSTRADVNSQFNIIGTYGNRVYDVLNFAYRNDLTDYISTQVYQKKSKDVFVGSSIHDIYSSITKHVSYHNVLNNVKISLSNNIDMLYDEMNTDFYSDKQKAHSWLSETIPEDLHYNHGSIIYNKQNYIENVIEELNKKATSSRAIIPLINKDEVVSSGDSFLPSLNIIQFGFKNDFKDKLLITLYLRALEVSNFLKINICESLILAKKIKDGIRSIRYLDINIFTFRAQYIPSFGCLEKAEIDRTSGIKLYRFLVSEDYDKLKYLIDEKLHKAETVIVDDGIRAFYEAIYNYHEAFQNMRFYTIQKLLSEIINNYDYIKKLRASTSLHTEVKPYEDDIKLKMQNIIDNL